MGLKEDLAKLILAKTSAAAGLLLEFEQRPPAVQALYISIAEDVLKDIREQVRKATTTAIFDACLTACDEVAAYYPEVALPVAGGLPEQARKAAADAARSAALLCKAKITERKTAAG